MTRGPGGADAWDPAITVREPKRSRGRNPARVVPRLRRLISPDGWLFAKSAMMLGLARLGLTVLSFQTLLRVVKRLAATSPGRTFPRESTALARVQWGVDRASRCVPGARNCLTQALAAHVLLARRGRPTELRIGVCRDETGRLAAHAWLESEGRAIFGVPTSGLHQYRILPPLDRA